MFNLDAMSGMEQISLWYIGMGGERKKKSVTLQTDCLHKEQRVLNTLQALVLHFN